ncbi:hypothetical protein BGZ79_006198 [Entomortierella chlamydospora]|nr:hypothetical protein BGZ79_006198 [Entomortierella chlamydospora]
MFNTTWKYVSIDQSTMDAHTIVDDVLSPNARVHSKAMTAEYRAEQAVMSSNFLRIVALEYKANCKSIMNSRIGIYHPLILVNSGTLMSMMKNKLIRLAQKLHEAHVKLRPTVDLRR